MPALKLAAPCHGDSIRKSGAHAKRNHADFNVRHPLPVGVCITPRARTLRSGFTLLFAPSVFPDACRSAARPSHGRLGCWRSDWQPPNTASLARHQFSRCRFSSCAVSSAISAIDEFGLPLFAAFEDVPRLCERLVTTDVQAWRYLLHWSSLFVSAPPQQRRGSPQVLYRSPRFCSRSYHTKWTDSAAPGSQR